MTSPSFVGGPPAIVLGGIDNALSVARTLSRAGVRVHALNWPDAKVRFSRHCQWIPAPSNGGGPEAWERFLLAPAAEPLRGAVLLACEDAAIAILIRNERTLTDKFLLEESSARVRSVFLDKLATYDAAREAGVATPRYWRAASPSDLPRIERELVFPVLVKPRLQPEFRSLYPGRKYLRAEDLPSLRRALDEVNRFQVGVVLTEFIPGGDDRLCSCYAYLDESGRVLSQFTKRIKRRYPIHMGDGCYHVTDWLPEVRDLALRLFRHAGLRGLGNAEFKVDPRDGRLKLIEVNARFTSCDSLLVASGVDFARLTYGRLTGRPPEASPDYAVGRTQWRPVEDFLAYRELRRQGVLSLKEWIGDCFRSHVWPAFDWGDPLPSVVGLLSQSIRSLTKPWRPTSGPGGRAAQPQ